MALIGKLKDTVTGAVKVALAAGQQVQHTAAPAVKQTARLVRSQLDQRLGKPPAPRSGDSVRPPAPDVAESSEPRVAKVETPAAPNPAQVAKNIAPEKAKPAARKKPAKKAVPGAKLPVKRVAAKPDQA
jgi:hypothetical protein